MEEIGKFIQKSREVSWWEVEDMEEIGGGGGGSTFQTLNVS